MEFDQTYLPKMSRTILPIIWNLQLLDKYVATTHLSENICVEIFDVSATEKQK